MMIMLITSSRERRGSRKLTFDYSRRTRGGQNGPELDDVILQ